MTDMIERVARAFWGKMPQCDLQKHSVGPCMEPDDDGRCFCWDAARNNARAAIAAMRDPTREMLGAGLDWESNNSAMAAGWIWEAMIDAALAEGATTPLVTMVGGGGGGGKPADAPRPGSLGAEDRGPFISENVQISPAKPPNTPA